MPLVPLSEPQLPGLAEENQIMTAMTASAPWAPTREGSGPARDDPGAADLVVRARGGDKRAWDALVERYAPLIWSICRQYRLGRADAEDVGQSVWLRLVDHLDRIREPAALPGWLATTARRECGRLMRAAHGPHAALYPLDAENMADDWGGAADQEVLAAECHAALRQAFACLPPDGQQLIAMLIADPPVPYAQISARLGIPIGSIGPTRRRYLDRMRLHPAIATLAGTEPGPRPWPRPADPRQWAPHSHVRNPRPETNYVPPPVPLPPGRPAGPLRGPHHRLPPRAGMEPATLRRHRLLQPRGRPGQQAGPTPSQ
jgi:RNA polymerase sigma factor (sigma-70 family)